MDNPIAHYLAWSDPGLLRMKGVVRTMLGLAVGAGIAIVLSRVLGQPGNAIVLAVTSGQLLTIVVRDVTRGERIVVSLLLVPATWLAVALHTSFADTPSTTLIVVPFLFGGCFAVALLGKRAGQAGVAVAWTWLFAHYFRLDPGMPLWLGLCTSAGIAGAMLVRFVLWRDDRVPRRQALVESFRHVLARAIDRKFHIGGARAFEELQGMLDPLEGLLRANRPAPELTAALLELRLAVQDLLLTPTEVTTLQEISATLRDPGSLGEDVKGLPVSIPALLARVERALEFAAAPAPVRVSRSAPPRPDPRHQRHRALQVFVATGAAAALAWLVSDQRWAWAVLATMMLFLGTESSGQILLKGQRGVAGLAAGVFLGVGIGIIVVGHPLIEYVSIAILLFAVLYLIPVNYAIGSMLLTALLGIVFSLLGNATADVLLVRFAEVLIGICCGSLAASFVFPRDTRQDIRDAARAFLEAVADGLERDSSDGARAAFRRFSLAIAPTALPLLSLDRARIERASEEFARLSMALEVHVSTPRESDDDVAAIAADLRMLAGSIATRTPATTPIGRETSEALQPFVRSLVRLSDPLRV